MGIIQSRRIIKITYWKLATRRFHNPISRRARNVLIQSVKQELRLRATICRPPVFVYSKCHYSYKTLWTIEIKSHILYNVILTF
jgi:hypothetical protein